MSQGKKPVSGWSPKKPAHIINQPGILVGEKALSLCGVKYRVEILWEDLPPEHPICRDCVDAALAAMDAATTKIADVELTLFTILRGVDRGISILGREDNMTMVLEATTAYARQREAKVEAMRAKRVADSAIAKVAEEGDRP